MAIIEVIFVITVSVMAGFFVYSTSQQRQQQMQLENAFYQLLEAQNSCISLIQLTAAARVDVPLAKEYLDRQVQMFGVLPEVDADGDTFYRFPKLKRDSASDKN
ncbi:hypothetical protein H6F78_24745 [Coleofasciculus sp. FACHB-64]|uniref:hypothetical protein n=1 Tax=Cyanophyceae TaxID=3028117 RepID=UPI001688D6CD|nr:MULTISPECIES: hypothetical protein [unclassified Coleofasciculus]MBD1839607.1 hypothetical protein [Coleofasciculus sp. FACHB-501]MBD2048767.1 hypothetical protein [Coleofasciculus sp. FACHB-64]